MTSKHTPGEWRIVDGDCTWEKHVYVDDPRGGIHEPTGDSLPFTVGVAYGDTEEEAHANAAMFAASPDLLLAAQAQEILDRFIGNPDYSIHDFIADAKPLGYDDGAIQGGPEDWVAEIRRAAIAKAKGAIE